MSWSVNFTGTPEEGLSRLKEQFENAASATASVPHEQDLVQKGSDLTQAALRFLAGSGIPRVQVSGYGSGCNEDPERRWAGSISFNLSITPIVAKESPREEVVQDQEVAPE